MLCKLDSLSQNHHDRENYKKHKDVIKTTSGSYADDDDGR